MARGVIRSLPYLYREVNYSKFMLIDSVLRNVGVYSVKKITNRLNSVEYVCPFFMMRLLIKTSPKKKFKRNDLFIYS